MSAWWHEWVGARIAEDARALGAANEPVFHKSKWLDLFNNVAELGEEGGGRTEVHGSARKCTEVHGSARKCTEVHGSARNRAGGGKDE
jgi:hypothetical protein